MQKLHLRFPNRVGRKDIRSERERIWHNEAKEGGQWGSWRANGMQGVIGGKGYCKRTEETEARSCSHYFLVYSFVFLFNWFTAINTLDNFIFYENSGNMNLIESPKVVE